MGILTNSKYPDEMQQNAAFHLCLHCLRRLKQPSRTKIHHNEETTTFVPLEYKMVNPIIINQYIYIYVRNDKNAYIASDFFILILVWFDSLRLSPQLRSWRDGQFT